VSPINVSAASSSIDVTAGESTVEIEVSAGQVDVDVIGGQGPQGPPGPQGEPGESGGGDFLPLAGGTMTGNIVFGETGGQFIGKGLVDTERGGSYGIALVCSVGYQFNWQAGWILATEQNGSTPRPLYLDSAAGTTLRVWDAAENEGLEVAHDGITFADDTEQTTAWTGDVAAEDVTGLATVATSGSYDDPDDLPTLFDGAYSSLTGLPTLHDRSHAITSSSDHTATAWRVFHSNASGQIVELALGAAGTVLTSGGASAAPTWAAGGGAVRSDTVSNVSYIGRALSGSATSASVWTIRRTTVASAGTVTTATAANVKWDDRLTASYS